MKEQVWTVRIRRSWLLAVAAVMAVFILLPAMGHGNSYADQYKPANGDFFFVVQGTTLSASIKGSSIDNKANVQLAELENLNSMHMTIKKTGSWYYIVNKWSGKVLTAENGKKGANVWQYKNNKKDTQKWRFYKAGNNSYYIKNKKGYFLAVSGKIKAGSNIIVTKKKNAKAFKWDMVKKKDPSTKMTLTNIQICSSLDNKMIIDLKGGMLEKGGIIQIHENVGKTSQKYRVRDAKNGYYYIQNGCSGKYLEVKDASTANGADVTQWTGRGGEKQQLWRFIPCGNGYYYIQNALGKYMTTDGHGANLRDVIQLEKGQAIKAQKWKIIKTSLGTKTYINQAKAFMNDDRWKNGITWVTEQTPKLNKYADWHGCAAYCYDWVKFMYGKEPRDVKSYTNADSIHNGDVVNIEAPDVHWFVVISRNGSWLKTAEGNASGKVRISTSAYTIKDGKLYDNTYNKFRPIYEAFHYGNHMLYDKG